MTTTIELPEVGEVRRDGDGWLMVDGYTYSEVWLDPQIEELQEALARILAAKAFVESERASQRVEEAAKIFHYARKTGFSWEDSRVQASYRVAAKAVLDAVANGLI